MNKSSTLSTGFAVLFVSIVSALPLPSLANTYVFGHVSTDTTWGGDTYYVTDDVTVDSNVRLTIQAGTTVKLDSHKKIIVSGSLLAAGSAGNTITFTASSTSPSAGFWGAI